MTERIQVLDCNRKAILGLPSPAFHLWMCYWMNEDDEQESYMSLDEIESQVDARISRRTIITWTQWLVAKGWLVDTGKTAADKFIQRGKTATRGAHQIRVYRVDDPTKGISQQSSKISPVQNLHQCKLHTRFLLLVLVLVLILILLPVPLPPLIQIQNLRLRRVVARRRSKTEIKT
jgi:hypothetical protein